MLQEKIAELKEKLEGIPDYLIEYNGSVDVAPIIAVIKQVFGDDVEVV